MQENTKYRSRQHNCSVSIKHDRRGQARKGDAGGRRSERGTLTERRRRQITACQTDAAVNMLAEGK